MIEQPGTSRLGLLAVFMAAILLADVCLAGPPKKSAHRKSSPRIRPTKVVRPRPSQSSIRKPSKSSPRTRFVKPSSTSRRSSYTPIRPNTSNRRTPTYTPIRPANRGSRSQAGTHRNNVRNGLGGRQPGSGNHQPTRFLTPRHSTTLSSSGRAISSSSPVIRTQHGTIPTLVGREHRPIFDPQPNRRGVGTSHITNRTPRSNSHPHVPRYDSHRTGGLVVQRHGDSSIHSSRVGSRYYAPRSHHNRRGVRSFCGSSYVRGHRYPVSSYGSYSYRPSLSWPRYESTVVYRDVEYVDRIIEPLPVAEAWLADETVVEPGLAILPGADEARQQSLVPLQQGDQAFRAGQYGEARRHYIRAQIEYTYFGEALLAYAITHFAEQEFGLAALTMRRALAHSPDLIHNPIDLVRFYGDGAKLDAHHELLQNYLVQNPAYTDGWLLLAYVRFAQGDPSGALSALDRVLAIGPAETVGQLLRDAVIAVLDAGPAPEQSGVQVPPIRNSMFASLPTMPE